MQAFPLSSSCNFNFLAFLIAQLNFLSSSRSFTFLALLTARFSFLAAVFGNLGAILTSNSTRLRKLGIVLKCNSEGGHRTDPLDRWGHRTAQKINYVEFVRKGGDTVQSRQC